MKRLYTLLIAGAFAGTVLTFSAVSAATTTLSSTDAGEISTGYDHLTTDFYKRVDPQTVLNSVRSQLLFAMRTAGVKNPSLKV